MVGLYANNFQDDYQGWYHWYQHNFIRSAHSSGALVGGVCTFILCACYQGFSRLEMILYRKHVSENCLFLVTPPIRTLPFHHHQPILLLSTYPSTGSPSTLSLSPTILDRLPNSSPIVTMPWSRKSKCIFSKIRKNVSFQQIIGSKRHSCQTNKIRYEYLLNTIWRSLNTDCRFDEYRL